ncbi:hypothetical protein D3C76_971930 [compost metagenome]
MRAVCSKLRSVQRDLDLDVRLGSEQDGLDAESSVNRRLRIAQGGDTGRCGDDRSVIADNVDFLDGPVIGSRVHSSAAVLEVTQAVVLALLRVNHPRMQNNDGLQRVRRRHATATAQQPEWDDLRRVDVDRVGTVALGGDVATGVDDIAVASLTRTIRADGRAKCWKLSGVQADEDAQVLHDAAGQDDSLNSVPTDGRRGRIVQGDDSGGRVRRSRVVLLVDLLDDPTIRLGTRYSRAAVNEVGQTVVLAWPRADDADVQNGFAEGGGLCAGYPVAGHPAQRIDLAAVDGQRVRIPRQQ